MIKKIFLFLFVFSISNTYNVFAAWEKQAYEDAKKATAWYEAVINSAWSDPAAKAEAQRALDSYRSTNNMDLKTLKDNYDSSAEAQWDITSRWFTISVDDISPGMWVQWTTTKQNVNYLLGTIIQNLMIALWSLAILIMTIWAWYMLTYYGQDEQLSKWKKMFMSGVYAMITALSAYYIVSIVRYLLYFGDN